MIVQAAGTRQATRAGQWGADEDLLADLNEERAVVHEIELREVAVLGVLLEGDAPVARKVPWEPRRTNREPEGA